MKPRPRPRFSLRLPLALLLTLKARGVPHETMFKANEGHGFAQPESRIELFERVERSLAQHLR